MEIFCNKVKGFCSSDKMLKIYDSNHRPFYFKKNLKNKFFFNLPKGIYFTENNISELKEPIRYDYGLIPKRSVKPLPSKFTLIVERNPHKCSIDTLSGKIFIDPSINNLPKFIKDFIICHELAHFYVTVKHDKDKYGSIIYDSVGEGKCDLLANKWMLRRGYNPSQIHLASGLTLNDCKRKSKTTNFNKNVKFYI